MNPIFTWLMAKTVAETLARRCPKCRRKQLVPKEKIKQEVPCQRCGTSIPPQRKLQ